MDNKNFISNLAQRLGCDNATAQRLVDGFGTIVRETCADAGKVAIPGFGTFEGVKHDDEIITDLASGRRMLLPPSIEATFSASGMLKKKVREGSR